jgi:hypothetical protein
MKKIIPLFLLLSVICLVDCSSSRKIEYNIPKYFTGERKQQLIENLEKGRILFQNNCSECHGITGKAKQGMPDFTNKEIQNYLNAYQTNDTRNHAVLKKLLPEELSMVITFLQMRKIDSLPNHQH